MASELRRRGGKEAATQSPASEKGRSEKTTGAASPQATQVDKKKQSSGKTATQKSTPKEAHSKVGQLIEYIASYSLPFVVIITLIALALYAPRLVHTYQLAYYPRSFGTHTVVSSIERLEWDPSRPVAAEMIRGGVPKVLTNTFAKNWTALRNWDVDGEYLMRYMPKTLVNVYRNKHQYFGPLFRPHKPLTRMKGVEWENPHEMISMPTEAFFAQVNGRATNTNGTYLYYTGDLSAPVLAKDLEPWRDLIPRVEQQRVNVWVSQKGVTAHLHVDSYENFFVQIRGRKRMLLFPPESSVNAPLYPFLHPSFGQAQPYIQAVPPNGAAELAPETSLPTNEIFSERALRLFRTVLAGVFAPAVHATAKLLTRGTGCAVPEGSGGDPVSIATGRTRASELAKFPELTGLVGYEAILEPGDMMYIPPNWYHHVEALDPSISVNFWSASWAQTYYDKAIQLAVSSLVHDWSFPQKRSAAAYLIQRVIEECQAGMDFGEPNTNESLAVRFFKRHVFSRYADMMARGQLSPSPLFPDNCEISDNLLLEDGKPEDHTHFARLLGLISQDETLPPETPTNQKALRSLLELSKKISEHFMKIKANERPIWLANFFESIAYWTGDVDGAHVLGSLHCICYANTEDMHKGATFVFKSG